MASRLGCSARAQSKARRSRTRPIRAKSSAASRAAEWMLRDSEECDDVKIRCSSLSTLTAHGSFPTVPNRPLPDAGRSLPAMRAQQAGDHEQAARGPETGQRSVGGDGVVIGLVACAAGGRLSTIRDGFVEPALQRGWRVAVTLTPTASRWLSDGEELARIEQATGLPVRDSPRLPHEPRPHPELACCVVAPASANTVAKLANSQTPTPEASPTASVDSITPASFGSSIFAR